VNKCWPHLFGFTGKCKGSFKWRPFQTETTISLLSHCFWISSVHILAAALSVLNCAWWVYLLTLVFIWILGTHWSSIHGMGVATSVWACTFLPFIKQISRLNNFFDIEDCHMVVWLLGSIKEVVSHYFGTASQKLMPSLETPICQQCYLQNR